MATSHQQTHGVVTIEMIMIHDSVGIVVLEDYTKVLRLGVGPLFLWGGAANPHRQIQILQPTPRSQSRRIGTGDQSTYHNEISSL